MGRKYNGAMMSGDDAVNLLTDLIEEVKPDRQEDLKRARNRLDFLNEQAKPVPLVFHKGKYGSKYDSWTCRNCGCEISHGVVQNFCWNCGHALKWDSPRCLTGNGMEREKHGSAQISLDDFIGDETK